MMVVQHADGPSLVDVLDRVLDKGIVIDAWSRVSLVGIDMIMIESRVTVASFDTYVRYAEPLRYFPTIARPVGTTGTFENSKPPPAPAHRPSRSRK